jgi:spore coat polysaccharide biosynthesis protein SpsF
MKAIFITVRTGSKRLPRKALLKINGRRTIELVIDNAKRSWQSDIIVLCTTTLSQDSVLCQIARKNGIQFFRGSAEDKLERWKGAAEQFGVDCFVTADGDDLLCEPELMDLAFDQLDRNAADFIEWDNLPCGAFSYAIRVSALNKVCEIKDSSDTEMMWVYFKETGLFNCEKLACVPDKFRRPEIRMTLDYPDDMKFFKEVFGHFKNKRFTLWDTIEYLDEHPEVIKINQHLQEEFLDNQRAKTNMVLK